MKMRSLVSLFIVMISIFLLSGNALAAGKRTVKMWSFAANNVEEWKAREKAIESQFDIDLQIELVAQNAFVQKLQAVLMEGKNAPDIIEWMIENNRILNADPKKSFVLPLDNYVKDSKLFGDVVKGRVDWVTYGSSIYGLPHDVHPVVLVYNDTLWQEAGVDVAKIKTWDEFFEKSKKLTADKKDGKPIHYALPYGYDGLANTMFMIWQQTGSQILDKNGKPTFTSPDFTAFVNKWMEWQKTNAFCQWDWGNFSALLANGTLCAYLSPDWWIPQVDEASKKYTFKVRELPKYNDDSPTSASWGGSFLAIPKGTKDPDKIFKIIEYMQYNPDSMIARWKETTMLPPMEKVWSNPAFKAEDPRFKGQSLGEIMISGAKSMPKINTGDVFWDALNDFSSEYAEIASKKKSVTEGLAAAQKRAMQRLN